MKRGIGVLLAMFLTLMMVGTSPATALDVSAATAAAKPLVIVLDPGHGGTDGGAARTWNGKTYTEKLLNLKIAQYAKEELEQYMGVKVYLTRTNDTYVALKDRVLFAKGKGADLFVSIHNNADYSSTRRGACVYYPNASYQKQISEEGRLAALSIQKQLAALGLKDLGVTYRNSENYTRYPDNKLADYYLVIKHSKLYGFPGLIVEHAYVSNALDCSQYLSSDSQLKRLGIADATGIANAYGLVKGETPVLKRAVNKPKGRIKLTWSTEEEADSYLIYRRKEGKDRFSLLDEVVGDQVKYKDTTAVSGKTYEYYVQSKYCLQNGIYCTEASNQLSVTALKAPKEVTVTRQEEGGIALAFLGVKGAHGYLVAGREGEDEDYTVVAELDGDTLNWEDPDVGEESMCDYQVCAYVMKDEERIYGAYTPAIVDTIEMEEEISQ